jgi:hypothetical protein
MGYSRISKDFASKINDYFNHFEYHFEIRPNYHSDTKKNKLIKIY